VLNSVPHHEDVLVSGGIAPRIYNLDNRCIGGGEWSSSRSGHFSPGVGAPRIHQLGGWVGLRTSLDAVAKRKISPVSPIEPWTSSP